MSVKHMFLNADPVVQVVILILLLASLTTWLVIFEKILVLRRADRDFMLFKQAAARQEDGLINITDFSELAEPVVLAGIKESSDASGQETRSEFRERVERSMRTEFAGLIDRLGKRTLLLATVASVSPFMGLFGTVWGIMNSFIGIAASGETTIAVVAPGIAEALFATAMGLAAAIPAVVAYNKIIGALRKITKEALIAISLIGNYLARIHFCVDRRE